MKGISESEGAIRIVVIVPKGIEPQLMVRNRNKMSLNVKWIYVRTSGGPDLSDCITHPSIFDSLSVNSVSAGVP